MGAQDAIQSRIIRFPVPSVDKLEDIEVQIPKIIILNKQIYEVMFTLLQTHPCYLINWLCAAIAGNVNLFDDHPLAFLDEEFLTDHPDISKAINLQNAYLNKSEQQIMIDEYCYLLLAAFGGFKSIRNDRRIVSNLTVIAYKVFEFEINQDEGSGAKLEYSLDDILHNRVDCGYIRIQRLVFHSQFQNMAFIEELFELIVKKMRTTGKKYSDGVVNNDDREANRVDIFDYEAVMKNSVLVDLRARNLMRFLTDVVESIIMFNIDPENRKRHLNECKHNFTNEVLMLTLKANSLVSEKTAALSKGGAERGMTVEQRARRQQVVDD